MLKFGILIMTIFIMFSSAFVFSQETDDELLFCNYEKLSLTDILYKMKVDIATGNTNLTTRESPSIVSVITAKEIRNLGARDIIDVLEMIPGFSFGADVWGVVGIGVRGNWANEGKVLLLMDGQELNDFSYASMQFGHHYPVDLIKRIEIIRGPGSTIYGGYAELAVINIITKSAEDLNGGEITATWGTMQDAEARKNLTLSYGKKVNEDFKISSSFFIGEGIRSDREYSDFYGNTFEMEDHNKLNPKMAKVDMQYKDFSFYFLADEYATSNRDGYDVSYPDDVNVDFFSYIADVKYNFIVSDKINITPKVNYTRQKPWRAYWEKNKLYEIMDSEEWSFSDETVERMTEELVINYSITDSFNLLTGVESYQEEASNDLPSYNGNYEVSYDNEACYLQGLLQSELGNITLGARYDNNSESGSAFVPRAAYTKLFENFHTKFLYGKSFRTPSISNISYSIDSEGVRNHIVPEVSTIYEVEVGYTFIQKVFLSANFFQIEIDDPIVYYYDEIDVYSNFDKTGTQGVELECKYKDNWGYVNLNYSYYEANDNKVDQYKVFDTEFNVIDEDVMLGFPQHKVGLYSSFKIVENFSINPSLIYSGEKWGYNGVTEDDILLANKFDSTTIINLNFSYEKLLNRWDLMIGVMNLTDEEILYIQPYYDGYHAPLPGSSREYFIKASCKM